MVLKVFVALRTVCLLALVCLSGPADCVSAYVVVAVLLYAQVHVAACEKERKKEIGCSELSFEGFTRALYESIVVGRKCHFAYMWLLACDSHSYRNRSVLA